MSNVLATPEKSILLEVYVRHDNQHWLQWQVYRDQDTVCAPPFDAISFELDGLWG